MAVEITTSMILNLAYSMAFCVTRKRTAVGTERFLSHCFHETRIECASFNDSYDNSYDPASDHFEAATEKDGKHCWVRVDRVRYIPTKRGGKYERKRCGIVKTLEEGRVSWQNMGAVAGTLAYVANFEAAPALIKRAKQLEEKGEL